MPRLIGAAGAAIGGNNDTAAAVVITMIALTGVTGALGGQVAAALAGSPIRLLARTPDRAPQIPGAEVAAFDYANPATLRPALEGVHTLLFISAAESADRRRQHRNVVDAAAAAGVGHIVYTSFAGASPDATFTLGRDHADTEAALAESGVAVTLLRDNFYSNLLPLFAGPDGVILGPAGTGKVAAVARQDVGDVATKVLQSPSDHADATYYLTGPEALTMAQIAERASAVTGRTIRYQEQTVQEAYQQRAADYPDAEQWQLDAWVSTYTAIAEGTLAQVSGDVEQVTGHAPRTIEQALAG